MGCVFRTCVAGAARVDGAGVRDAGCGVIREAASDGTRAAGSGVIRECDITGLCGAGLGIGPERICGRTCEAAWKPPPCFFASPGGMQPEEPGEQPHPVLLPWLHPGGVPPFCFQLALPWPKPAGDPLLAKWVW